MAMGISRAIQTAEVGTVDSFAMPIAPAGWLECNGAMVSRTAYAALFAKIGTIYGAGDGATTFQIPDLRGEFVRGWDNGRGVDPRVIGSAQAGQMPSHTHTTWNTTGGTFASGSSWHQVPSTKDAENRPTGTAGGTENGNENRPRNVAMMFCIKF